MVRLGDQVSGWGAIFCVRCQLIATVTTPYGHQVIEKGSPRRTHADAIFFAILPAMRCDARWCVKQTTYVPYAHVCVNVCMCLWVGWQGKLPGKMQRKIAGNGKVSMHLLFAHTLFTFCAFFTAMWPVHVVCFCPPPPPPIYLLVFPLFSVLFFRVFVHWHLGNLRAHAYAQFSTLPPPRGEKGKQI